MAKKRREYVEMSVTLGLKFEPYIILNELVVFGKDIASIVWSV